MRALPLLLLLAACPIDPAALPEMTFSLGEQDFWRAPPPAPALAPGEGRIYVTNNFDDTVSVLDLDALDVVATVPVGFVPVEREGPHHCAVDPAGEFFYVGISNFVPGSGSGPHGVHGAGTADGHVMKYRVSDNSFVAAERIDRNPGDVRLLPDGSKLLATHFDQRRINEALAQGITSGPELDARLAIVDTASMKRDALVPACPAPHGIGISEDGRKAVLSCLSDEVAIVDVVDHSVVRVAVLDEPGDARAPICNPYAITMDGATAWVSCYNTGQLIAVDVESGARDGRVFQLVGAAVFGEARAGLLVIAHQNSDGITLIDTAGPTQVSRKLVLPDVCVLPHVARFSEDGSAILVVCEGNRVDNGHLLELDAERPHAVRKRVELGRFPDDLAIVRRPPT